MPSAPGTGTAVPGADTAATGSSGCLGLSLAIVGLTIVIGLIIEYFAWFVGALVVLGVLGLIGYVQEGRERTSPRSPSLLPDTAASGTGALRAGRAVWSAGTPPAPSVTPPPGPSADVRGTSRTLGAPEAQALEDG